MLNRYCAINAKIKAMYSESLSDDDYMSMLVKTSVPEVCSILKNSEAYGDVFMGLNDANFHRGNIESILNHKLFVQFVRLYNFMNRDERNIIKFWFMRLEIEYLKHKIRHIFNNETEEYNPSDDENSTFFKEHTKIDCEIVNNARVLGDFILACKNTPYYDLLRTAESINSEYFSIVMMFDRLYYTLLWKAKDKLPKSEARAFADFVGPSIDMLNLMWIYRGKKYFNFDREIIYTYLIPVKYRLSETDVRNMVDSESDASILSIINNTKYKELFSGVGGEFFAEENYHQLEYKYAKRTFIEKPMSMAAVFAYFQLKETEIYNITTIIECVRYGISPDLIKQHVRV